MNKKLVWLLILSLALAACQKQSLTVGNEYMNALQDGDIDSMLETVSDDIALVVSGDPIFHNELTGKNAMREYLENNAASGFKLELTADPIINDNQLIYPNRFAINDFTAIGVDWVTGQDELTIENGKITRDVWTIDDVSRTKLTEVFANLQRQFEANLIGTWHLDGETESEQANFRYHPDGTYELVRYIVGAETMWDKGVYSCEGNLVTLTTTEAYYCKVDDKGVYEMQFLEDGSMQISLVDELCWKRKPPVDGPVTLKRIVE